MPRAAEPKDTRNPTAPDPAVVRRDPVLVPIPGLAILGGPNGHLQGVVVHCASCLRTVMHRGRCQLRDFVFSASSLHVAYTIFRGGIISMHLSPCIPTVYCMLRLGLAIFCASLSPISPLSILPHSPHPSTYSSFSVCPKIAARSEFVRFLAVGTRLFLLRRPRQTRSKR